MVIPENRLISCFPGYLSVSKKCRFFMDRLSDYHQMVINNCYKSESINMNIMENEQKLLVDIRLDYSSLYQIILVYIRLDQISLYQISLYQIRLVYIRLDQSILDQISLYQIRLVQIILDCQRLQKGQYRSMGLEYTCFLSVCLLPKKKNLNVTDNEQRLLVDTR